MCISLTSRVPVAPRREEFLSAFEEQVAVLRRQEEIQTELEACGSDMERMAPVLDELDALSKQVRMRGGAAKSGIPCQWHSCGGRGPDAESTGSLPVHPRDRFVPGPTPLSRALQCGMGSMRLRQTADIQPGTDRHRGFHMSAPSQQRGAIGSQAIDLDINLLDKAIDRMMPELGFGPDDNDSEPAVLAPVSWPGQ